MTELQAKTILGRVMPTDQHDSGQVTTSDGLDLFWRGWLAAKPCGVIILVHGLADHSGRYTETALHFAAHGWTVYACDLRGHGLSPDGHRSGRVHINHFSDYARDVTAMLSLSKQRHPNLPHIVLGHSMGGLIGLNYALDHPAELDGVVLSSPLLATHPGARPARPLDFLVRFLELVYPRLLFPSDLYTGAISRDPEVVRAYIDDPLVSDRVSAGWYGKVTRAIAGTQQRAAELAIPTLLMQSGADRLVDPGACHAWAAAAPAGLLELQVWEGLYHEMFNEPEKDRVRTRVLEWLARKIPTTAI